MSFGGSTEQTSTTELPSWLEDAAQQNIAQSQAASQIGYVPYMGPDVAAFSPMQQASFDNTNAAANAFGLSAPTSTGVAEPTTYANGVQGYSGYNIYEDALAALAATNPGQYSAIQSMFVDPRTGRPPGAATWSY